METAIYRETDEGEEEITVQFHYGKETKDYFDKSFGNWLPGDPSEFFIVKATNERGEEVKLTDEEVDRLEEEACDICRDAEQSAAEDAAILAYENDQEARWERDMEKY